MVRMNTRTERWQGSKWIRPEKRHALYARGGMRCAWCNTACVFASPKSQAPDAASLDHVVPASWFEARGMKVDNAHTNLVVACLKCNKSRHDEPAVEWAAKHGASHEVMARIDAQRQSPFDLDAGRALRAARRNGETP